MSTAPAVFDIAPDKLKVAPLSVPSTRLRRELTRVVRYGALGAAIAISGLAALAVVDARIHSDAVARLIGWF